MIFDFLPACWKMGGSDELHDEIGGDVVRCLFCVGYFFFGLGAFWDDDAA